MFDSRTNLSKNILDMIKSSYGDYIRVFDTVIPRSVKVGEANANSKSIIEYMPNNKAAIAYNNFTNELLSYNNPFISEIKEVI